MVNRLKADGFAKYVGILVGGTVAARLVFALALPFITRLYSPEDFELLAVYMAALALVTSIASLRLGRTIPLPDSDEEASNLLALSLIAATAFGALLAILTVFFPQATVETLGKPEFLPYRWLLPAGVVLASTYQSLQFWASRKRRYKLVAKTRLGRALSGASTQLGLGTLGIAPFGLLFGHMIYNGFGSLPIVRDILCNDRPAISAISFKGMRQALNRYRNFPIYSVPEALANSASVQVPIILISVVAAGPEAGYLALAMQVMAMPMALVGQSVAQVYIAEAPKRLRDGTLKHFTYRTILALFKIGAVVLIPIGLLAPFVFGPLFGPEWARAGEMVLWMTPWHVLQLAAAPLTASLHVTGHLRLAMGLQLAGAAIRIGLVVIASRFAVDGISEVYAVSGAIFYGLFILVVTTVIKGAKHT